MNPRESEICRTPPPPRWNAPRAGAGMAAAALAAGFLFTAALWFGGDWFVSHEMAAPLIRLAAFEASLREGQFPPRWQHELMGGYGYPLFNFFPPLSFLAAEPFRLAGAPAPVAWKLALLFARAAGIAGMFFWLRRKLPNGGGAAIPPGALAGAALYGFAPYHAATLYVRGNLPEFLALNLWPWAFWAADRLIREREARPAPREAFPPGALALAAVALAMVPLSHLLTGYLLAWNLILYCAGRLALGASAERRLPEEPPRGAGNSWRPSVWRAGWVLSAARLALAALWAGALAAFFVAPALLELRYCRPETLTQSIRFEEHFVSLWQLVNPRWGYGLSLPGPGDTMPFQLGLALWAAVAAGFVVWFRGQRRGAGARPPGALAMALVFFLLCLGAMTPASRPLWRWIPGSEFLQFPWRLLIPATFWAATAGGLVIEHMFGSGAALPRRRRAVLLFVLAAPALLCAPFLRPLLFMLEVPEYTPAALRGAMLHASSGEYLPASVREAPRAPSPRGLLRISGVSGEGRIAARPLPAPPGEFRWEIELERESALAQEVFWFPGWRARAGEDETPTFPATPQGLVGWRQPPGKREVRVWFGETPLRRAANWLSLAALALAAGAPAAARFRRRARAERIPRTEVP